MRQQNEEKKCISVYNLLLVLKEKSAVTQSITLLFKVTEDCRSVGKIMIIFDATQMNSKPETEWGTKSHF